MYRSNTGAFGNLAYNRLNNAVGVQPYLKQTEDEDNTVYVVGGIAVAALAVGGLVYMGAKKRKKGR